MQKILRRFVVGVAAASSLSLGCGSSPSLVNGGDAGGADSGQATHDATTWPDAVSPTHDAGTGHDGAAPADAGGTDGGGAHDGSAPVDASSDHHAGDGAVMSGDGAADGHSSDAHSGDAHSSDAHVGDAHLGDAKADGHTDAAPDAPVDTGTDVAMAPPTFLQHCGAGNNTTLTGTVYAPNGVDPIPSVRVYAAKSINPYPAGYCDKCSAPIDPAYTATFSAPNGTFSLDLNQVPYGATIELAIQIGRFRTWNTIPVTACQSAAVTMADEILPGANAANANIPRIVVSSGEVDHLDEVLANLGITEYDCYEGRKNPTVPPSTTTCQEPVGLTIADVLTTPAGMAGSIFDYDMAFLSCAPGAYAKYVTTNDQSTMTTSTQNWVNGGGRLFVTDTAYDYIAQAFPSDMTWYGQAGSPQPIDSANVGCAPDGPGGSSAHTVEYTTTIADSQLAAWLQVENIIPTPPPVPATALVEGYYEPWSAVKSVPMSTQVIANGTMPIDPTYPSTQCGNPTQTNLPLTTQFDVASCGRVMFSSFHTYTGTTSATVANEKIMEFLIFAAAVCSG